MIDPILFVFMRAALTILLAILPSALAPLGDSTLGESSLRDERATFSEVCFAAAAAYTSHPTILRSAPSLRQFHAQLADRCRRPLPAPHFDFTMGRILFGIWSRGEGCGARHILTQYERDDAAGRITVRARLVTFGDCPYELLQPLWLSAPAGRDYRIDLRVDSP